ncbi:MAG TPA: amidohydrolase family protein [Blastocatellia bacterium]|nr:amidohydrolase family protein [Blastocatellia bacterium]
MRIRRKLPGLLAFFLIASCSSASPAAAAVPEQRPLAFVRVNVVTMTRDGLLKDQTVVVEGGKITRVGPSASVRLPRNARRIDGRGKYLMPGLVDFHVHLRDPSELLSYLIHGVTTVVQMSGPTGNVPDVLALRRRIAGGEIAGPNVYTTGRILDGDPAVFPGVSTVVKTPAEARRAVEEQYRAGVDFIKVYNNLTSDVLRAAVEAAHRRGLAVIGHIPRRDGRPQALQTALAAGQDMIAHGEEFFFTYFYGDADSQLNRGLPPQPERSKIPSAVRMVRESGAAVTPNLSFVAMTRRQLDSLDAVLSDPETRYLHPDVLALWREQNPTRRTDLARFSLRERAKYAFLKELTPALQAGGVLLLLGTDSSAPGLFPGASAQLELRELVEAGLKPHQALAAGTRNAGQFIKRHVRGAETFGTVAPGQRADLLLLEANPLTKVDNISRIAGVTVRGRWLSKGELEKMRDEAAASFPR